MTKSMMVGLVVATALTACHARSSRTTVADAGTPSVVQVWPGMEVATVADIPTELAAPWKNGTFFLKGDPTPGHADRPLASCNDLTGVWESDVRLAFEWERYNFREKSIRCSALALVRTARPARVSYVRDLVSASDPGDALPAAVAPAISSAVKPGSLPASEARPAAGSWRGVDPTLTFDRTGARAGYEELVVGGAYRGRLTWWAAGDFDGDDIEDVLMFSNLAPTALANAPNVMRAFVLTRRQAGGPVILVKQLR